MTSKPSILIGIASSGGCAAGAGWVLSLLQAVVDLGIPCSFNVTRGLRRALGARSRAPSESSARFGDQVGAHENLARRRADGSLACSIAVAHKSSTESRSLQLRPQRRAMPRPERARGDGHTRVGAGGQSEQIRPFSPPEGMESIVPNAQDACTTLSEPSAGRRGPVTIYRRGVELECHVVIAEYSGLFFRSRLSLIRIADRLRANTDEARAWFGVFQMNDDISKKRQLG